MHIGYFHHNWDCVEYTSLDGPSQWGWFGAVAQVMASGTKWLTVGVFSINVTSGFNFLLNFQTSNLSNYSMSYGQYKPVGYISYLY